MILISLPVHEKVEVILDQIENFKKYAPEALVVIHPARQFKENSPVDEALRGIEGVWVNPDPLYTGFGMVLKCHISNYNFARKAGIPFTHFCFHASNDLFVRPGVEDYVRRHEFGFFQHELSRDSILFTNWVADFHRDNAYQKIMGGTGAKPTNLASQVEGTFYPREAFDEFAKLYTRHAWKDSPWPFGPVQGENRRLISMLKTLTRSPRRRTLFGKYAYPREEFYQANFFSTLCPNPSAPYCFMNWDANLDVTAADIENIRRGTNPLENYLELFAVKRVDRNVNDALRTMIRSLDP